MLLNYRNLCFRNIFRDIADLLTFREVIHDVKFGDGVVSVSSFEFEKPVHPIDLSLTADMFNNPLDFDKKNDLLDVDFIKGDINSTFSKMKSLETRLFDSIEQYEYVKSIKDKKLVEKQVEEQVEE